MAYRGRNYHQPYQHHNGDDFDHRSVDGQSTSSGPPHSSRQPSHRGRSNYVPRGTGGGGRGRGGHQAHCASQEQIGPHLTHNRGSHSSGLDRQGPARPDTGYQNRGRGSSNQDSYSHQLRARLESMQIELDDTHDREVPPQPEANPRYEVNRGGNAPQFRPQPGRGRDGGGFRRGGAPNFHNRQESIGNILARLTDASTPDVLAMVGDPRSPLRTFLSSRDPCSNKDLARLFQLFHNVAESEAAPEMSAQFIIVLISSTFMKETLFRFIASDFPLAHERIEEFPKFLENLLDVLMTCFVRSGALAQTHLAGNALMLERQIEVLTGSHPNLVTAAVQEKLTHLTNVRLAATAIKDSRGATTGEATQQTRWEVRMSKQDAAPPPEDFRRLSVFPVQADIQMDSKDVFIRRNIVQGVYDSVETYLDIHYRLMREDFVEPLRKGVRQYLEVMERAAQPNAGNRRRERLDLKVYTDVRVSSSFPTRDVGVVHDLKFSVERLQRVMWDKGKRLPYGSLVCLSSDDFRTMYFAIIVLREVDDLKKGVVTVKFNQHVPPKLGVYIMAESSVFFEAYRHTLTRLRELREDNFPMRDVLLGKFLTDRVTPPLPEYLRTDATISLDLSPLMSEDVKKRRGGEYPRVYPRGKNVWPHPDDLGLDDSQFAAFKNSLTRDVALIQGPPGCGKTYVGLKIVQTLLGVASKAALGPILIVCYTNHALDQFLEGILPFCSDGMVRVGRRCKSEELEKFNISNLRARRLDHFDGVARNLFSQLMNAEEQILKYQRNVEKSQKAILSVEELETIIPGPMKRDIVKCAKTPRKALTNWLLGIDNVEDGFDVDLTATCCQDLIECLLLQEIFTSAHTIVEEFRYNLDELENEFVDAADNFEEELRDVFNEQMAVSEARKRFKRPNNQDVVTEFENDSGWSVAASRKSLRSLIHRRLGSGETMTEAEAAEVHNVLNLHTEQRWRLYNYWRSRFLEECGRLTEGVEREYERLVAQYQEMRQMQDMTIFQRAKVIGMTTTGAARYGRVITELQPRIVVVEEAAEVLESHIVTALSRGTQHLILIGDHKQLRPNTAVYRLAKDYNFDVSLFERLINCKYPYDTLALQHRMRPEIAVLMKHIYDNLGNHPCVERYEHVRGMANDIFFFHHEHPESYGEESSSYSNTFEAEFIAALCRYLLLNGYEGSRITVLTLYSGQMFTIQRCMPKKDFEGVRISVVDNFQGEENDIILLSLVRSNTEDKIGFLDRENRICVALSRAKIGLFVIGNLELLSRTNDLWRNIVADMRKTNSLGSSLRLACQMHPDDEAIEVGSPTDFQKAPEGGCSKVCNERLVCGHACRRLCHPMDREHKQYQCQQPCSKTCGERNHPCTRRCYQDCGPCQMRIEAVLPKCSHVQTVVCSDDLNKVKCLHACEKKLPLCQHRCQAKCGQPCTTMCSVLVEATLPFCGHTIMVQCHLSTDNLWSVRCTKPCEVTDLPCGHPCKGTCGSCASGRLHQGCCEKSKKVLVCGHEMVAVCNQEDTATCNKKCMDSCGHNECPLKCGDLCVPCNEPCLVKCEHRACKRKCCEACDVPPCNEPCKTKFLCKKCNRKVPCVGLCSEICPKKCRECDKAELTEIFLGMEDEEGARYLLLPQCKHVVEVSGMDQNVKLLLQQEALQALTCPRCKTPISKRCTQRYTTEVNETQRLRKLALKNGMGTAQVIVPDLLVVDWNSMNIKITNLLKGRTPNATKYCDNEIMVVRDPRITSRRLQHSKTLLECLKQISSLQSDLETSKSARSEKTPLHLHITRSLDLLTIYVITPNRTFGPISVDAFKAERRRVECLVTCAKLNEHLAENADKKAIEDLKVEVDALMRAKSTNTAPVMTADQMDACMKRLQKIRETVLAPGLKITKKERDEIVAAMKFTQGHWYKCPQGHVYAIADCGGANQMGKCPDCGATIGGQHHVLAAGNQLASEMDGARAPAFSPLNYFANEEAARRIQAQFL